MDTTELERLVELVQNARIRELTLKQNGARITIRKALPQTTTGTALVPYTEETEEERRAVYESEEVTTYVEMPQRLFVTAPLVGLFRHVKPLIGLGAHVEEGQVVGVIEAMKLMNDVIAPVGGVVTDVLIEDGRAVEYGQTLFELQPSD
jgi:acetyl-CoA carboxylase biotin carboxyl carrier protein